MKYLHSGYILLCDRADHAEDGRINVHGLFDLFVVDAFPQTLNCVIAIGFGTPYERRQYRGHIEIEDPNGRIVYEHDFPANDPDHLLKGHAIFPAEILIYVEGCFTIKCVLSNWKNETVWEVTRQLWAMTRNEEPVDDAPDDAPEAVEAQ